MTLAHLYIDTHICYCHAGTSAHSLHETQMAYLFPCVFVMVLAILVEFFCDLQYQSTTNSTTTSLGDKAMCHSFHAHLFQLVCPSSNTSSMFMNHDTLTHP